MSKKHAPKVGSGSVVCQRIELVGDVTVGSRCVVHPEARLIAEAGPIIIGDGNIVEERASIVNRFPPGLDASSGQSRVMIIGNNNLFEIGSHCAALVVGDGNVLEAASRLGPGVELGSGCVIGARCVIDDVVERIPDGSVICGEGTTQIRRHLSEKTQSHSQMIDFLTKFVPNYHHVYKRTKPSPASK